MGVYNKNYDVLKKRKNKRVRQQNWQTKSDFFEKDIKIDNLWLDCHEENKTQFIKNTNKSKAIDVNTQKLKKT